MLRGVARPLFVRSFLAIAIVFFVGALLIKKDEVKSLMVSAEQPIPIDPPKATPTLFVPTVDNEPNWRAESVPTAWPKFTVLPNEKPLPAKTDVQKLALANDILTRWQSYKAGKTKQRPTTKESGQAITYLLTIDPKSSAFPTAWASFVQLRRVDREISQVERP
ncbi:MAG: hypothetical protein QOJ84_929 [Bradyrhizobium sp.]|jgi:hypothetical protein|nr:hypothetical protein [Bradyrhizobium sp.]